MATLDEIAAAAGVSKMTVSNVLNGKSKEMRSDAILRAQRIREIAAKMNYRPNAAAKAISSGRFGTIGLLSSVDISNGALFTSTLRAIRMELSERDMHLTMADLPDEKLTSEGYVPKILREWVADGLLINYIASIPPRMIELIEQHHIPSIWMNTKLKSDCAYPDDYSAAKQATEYLLGLGHKDIAYIHPLNSGHYSVLERKRGYERAMKGARLKPRFITSEYDEIPTEIYNWQDSYKKWLGAADRPTAVIAYAGPLAIATYCSALELGLKIPKQLSIIGFHEYSLSQPGRTITTMQIPGDAMGRIAIDMLLNKIGNPLQQLSSHSVPFRFIEGTTCAAPQ